MEKPCTRDHEHETIQGNDTRESAKYTVEYADAVLAAVVEIVAEKNFAYFVEDWDAPQQFVRSVHTVTSDGHVVHYLDYNKTSEDWRAVVLAAKNLLDTRKQQNYWCQPGTPVWNLVAALVPWQRIHVQIAYLPKANRAPANVAGTHRGSVLFHIDESISCESHVVAEVLGTRERFRKAVQYGIFFYGDAPDDQQPEARRSIRTFIARHDEHLIREAITRELDRGGG